MSKVLSVMEEVRAAGFNILYDLRFKPPHNDLLDK